MTKKEREDTLSALMLAEADAEDAVICLGEAISRLRKDQPMGLPRSRACQSLDRALGLVRRSYHG